MRRLVIEAACGTVTSISPRKVQDRNRNRTLRYASVHDDTMRTYGDGCAIAQALDLVGERWALLVVRELLLGPKRYTDLRRGLPNASPNVLSQRLGELERAGVLRRRKLPPPAGPASMSSPNGAASSSRRSSRSATGPRARRPGCASDAPVGVDSMILALRSRFDADAARGLRTRYELGLGEDRFRIEVGDARSRSPAEAPTDPTRRSTPTPTRSLRCSGEAGRSPRRKARGKMTIQGDKAAVKRFLRLFPMPEPVPAGSRRSAAAPTPPRGRRGRRARAPTPPRPRCPRPGRGASRRRSPRRRRAGRRAPRSRAPAACARARPRTPPAPRPGRTPRGSASPAGSARRVPGGGSSPRRNLPVRSPHGEREVGDEADAELAREREHVAPPPRARAGCTRSARRRAARRRRSAASRSWPASTFDTPNARIVPSSASSASAPIVSGSGVIAVGLVVVVEIDPVGAQPRQRRLDRAAHVGARAARASRRRRPSPCRTSWRARRGRAVPPAASPISRSEAPSPP